MSDNSVICSAIQMADRAIRRAAANRSSCEAEIRAALGALRYVHEALQWEIDKSKLAKFSVMDPMHTVESLANPSLTETATANARKMRWKRYEN
jgi:hypothetical protein